MKHAILPAILAALVAAAPASAAPGITGHEVDQDSDALTGAEITVSLDGPGAEYVYCDWTQGDTTVRVYLQGSGTEWTGVLPANHAGSAGVRLYVEDAQGGREGYPNYPEFFYNIAENTTDSNGLNAWRYPNLTDWSNLTGGTDPDWTAQNCDRVTGISQLVRLRGTANHANPPMTTKAAFQSGAFYTRKVGDGVGSIWFKAKVSGRQYNGGQLKILKFTSKGKSSRRTCYYQELATVTIPRATSVYEWHQVHIVLQDEADIHDESKCDDHMAQYVIYNDSPASPIDICDIVLTPLIPDVIVTKDEADYAPGYPSLQDPIEFHIAVSNRWALAPAANFTPVLMWRQQADDDWEPTPMTNRMGRTNTGDGVYACALDASKVDAGPFEYFYKVNFTGYTPTFAAIKHPQNDVVNHVINNRFGWGQYPFFIHTNDWALLTDANGSVNESRSPAYKPDLYDTFGGIQFATSLDVAPDSMATNGVWDFTHCFAIDDLNEGWPHAAVNYMVRPTKELAYSVPGEIEIQAPFSYLTFLAADGIRRFRSMYTHVTAVPRPWDGDHPGFDIDAGPVPGLADNYPMQLVGDYTWQAIIHQTNAIDSVFAVTGALHYVEGSTEYGHGATNGAAGSPFFWLEPNQDPTAINPPSADVVERFGSEAIPHERTVTYYVEHLVTNATPDEVDLLELVRPAGVSADIPYQWATVTGGGEESWHTITPAWMKASATKTERCLMEGVSGDGGQTWFYTQAAPLTIDYDDNDQEIVTTNWPAGGAWEPQVVEVDGVLTTNWWPAQIPAAWMTHNWMDATETGDVFPTYELSELDTNGWDFAALMWTTNENMTLVDVALSESAPGWAGIRLAASALAGATHATNSDATYIANVELGVEQEERTRQETYYTYRPVPDPYGMPQLGTRVQIDYDGFLMYRFCTTNGEYQVRRAAWQDFNDWAADINWFSRSFGLYDMQTFECDLEGRELTLFDSMSVRGFEEVNGLVGNHVDLQTGPEYWDGFLAKNAWAIDERQHRTATSENANRAVRLSPFSRIGGSLETTSGSRVDGRGTWTMKVRSSADDRIAAVYKNGYDWDNYFLAVQIMASAMSDAQGAYASVIFRYTDSENYAEARLIQKGGYRSVQSKMQLCRWLELEVWQTVNGVSTEIKPKKANGTTNFEVNWGVSGGSNNNRNFWRYPTGYDNAEATTTRFLLTQDATHPWTVGVAVNGSEAEVYVWGYNDALVDTSTEAKAPLLSPAYYTLNGALSEGTFGFDVYDVAATFHPWAFPYEGKPDATKTDDRNNCKFKLSKTGASAFKEVADGTGSPEGNYLQTTDRMADNVKPWTIWQAKGGTTAPGIGRGVPTAYYRIRTYRSGEEQSTDFSAPVPTVNEDWSDSWDEVNSPPSDRVMPVSSYAWQTVSFPMSLWDDTYVQIQALPYTAGGASKNVNLGAPVVDEFACEEWRGKTIFDPLITGNNAANRMAVESWMGTYAAIVADGRTGRKWELAVSRANPDEVQAVTTPLMEHGVGDIIFSYQAVNGPVTFVVELVDEDDGSITTVGSLTAQPSDKTASFYAPGLKATTGRLRVRAVPPGDLYQDEKGQQQESGSSIKGVLYLDNLIAHDYPNDADTSWEAYNMLISSFITPQGDPQASSLSWQKPLKFDGRAKQFDSYRSAVFNNSIDNETLLGLPLPDHEPFLQTPSIATGVGEVSFWYRAAPGNTQPAKLRFFVANSALTPDDQWVELTAEDLNYLADRHEAEVVSMTAITNIPPDLTKWTYFSAEFFQGDYRMLRIYGGTNDNARVLIDNVLITEPVRASIDVGSVEFLPGVPLCTTNTGARVKLVNPRKNPKDIRVFVDWYMSPGTPQPVDIETRSIEWETIQEPHYLPITVNGVRYTATYYIVTDVAHTNDMVSRTILPPNLKWGVADWPVREVMQDPQGNDIEVRGTGSIELFTNAVDGPYTFVSTNGLIPTAGLPADALVQYCVRVLYKGDFATPILSETQGRTRNGFWFENPSWYEPIDLNAYMGTETRPVAHFWNFTVSTNQAFVNEIKPIQYKSSGWSWAAVVSDEINPDTIESQFIELIGAKDGSIKGWQIEHAGKDPESGSFSPWAAPKWTNTLAGASVFREAVNATTNKGWGIYLVGGTSMDSPADEPLFPASMNAALAEETDTGKYGDYVCLDSPYGLTLKRKMGAYVDRVCWGGDNYQKDVEDLVAAGFRYIGFRTHSTMGSAYSLAWRGSRSNNDTADWNTQSSLTTGGFNENEEMILWPLAYEEPEVVPPLISQPVVTAFG